MKKSLLSLFAMLVCGLAMSQTYVKLNGLYALVGIVNPSIEVTMSHHSTISAEIMYSPWKSLHFKGHKAHFNVGYIIGEYRYYFREHNAGWYLGGNLGLAAFDISKPQFKWFSFDFRNDYSKGFGIVTGAVVGYEHRLGERWLMDAFFGVDYLRSWYNGYDMDGVINMDPHRPADRVPKNPDPFNGSSEIMPFKIGVSFGYRIVKPRELRIK